MRTPDHSPYPENKIEKINLLDGETAYFDGVKYQKGFDPNYGHYAKADTFIIGKNGPELEAHGGDCAIITAYDGAQKVGAVLHIDTVHLGDKATTEEFINNLLQSLADVSRDTTFINVFIDVEDMPDLPEEARQWKETIISKLQGHFPQIDSFTKGFGKDVRLNTQTGVLRVFDHDHRLIFSNEK